MKQADAILWALAAQGEVSDALFAAVEILLCLPLEHRDVGAYLLRDALNELTKERPRLFEAC